jgi:uncharacterized BrkB/YihY/UPF0761 family membrane protein
MDLPRKGELINSQPEREAIPSGQSRTAQDLAVQRGSLISALNTAKAAAYSGMLMLFPAIMVLTTLLALGAAGRRS